MPVARQREIVSQSGPAWKSAAMRLPIGIEVHAQNAGGLEPVIADLHCADRPPRLVVDTAPLRAMRTPQRMLSISPVECASGLMLNMHPSSSARAHQRQSMSRRQGLALISTAT